MERVKKKNNIISSILLIALILVCGMFFSACDVLGNDLGNNSSTQSSNSGSTGGGSGSTGGGSGSTGGGSGSSNSGNAVLSTDSTATYVKDLNYNEASSSAETNPIITSIINQISMDGSVLYDGQPANIIRFDLMSAYRLTYSIKDADGFEIQYSNVVIKNNEMAASGRFKYNNEDFLSESYVKGNMCYYYDYDGMAPTRNPEKKKRTLESGENKTICLSQSNPCGIFTVVKACFNTTGTVTKTGTNYKIVENVSSTEGKTVILQMDNNNNINAIYCRMFNDTLSREVVFSPFEGDLVFPDLSMYSAVSQS